MACNVNTAIAGACSSGIGKVTDEIQLLQLTAQAAANWVENVSPGTDVSLAAIQERACESGIGLETNEISLLGLIAQSLCNTQ